MMTGGGRGDEKCAVCERGASQNMKATRDEDRKLNPVRRLRLLYLSHIFFVNQKSRRKTRHLRETLAIKTFVLIEIKLIYLLNKSLRARFLAPRTK